MLLLQFFVMMEDLWGEQAGPKIKLYVLMWGLFYSCQCSMLCDPVSKLFTPFLNLMADYGVLIANKNRMLQATAELSD